MSTESPETRRRKIRPFDVGARAHSFKRGSARLWSQDGKEEETRSSKTYITRTG